MNLIMQDSMRATLIFFESIEYLKQKHRILITISQQR